MFTFLERKNLTKELRWQEEQEVVGTSRPRSPRGVPSPGAITYGLPDGSQVLAKHWHNRRLACMFEELSSGNVKFSVWAVNETARKDYFFASKRLQALLNDDPVGAADPPPPPEDVTLITEAEMAD